MLKIYKFATLIICLMVLTFSCSSDPDISSIEKRSQDLNKIVMCPVCPGESIDQSQHPLATQMRGIVLARLQDGWTDEQILLSFVDSYGSMVLLNPSKSGVNVILWLVPPLVLLLAAISLYLALRYMTRERGLNGDGDLIGVKLTQDDHALYVRRIEESGFVSGGMNDAHNPSGKITDSKLENVT